MPSTLPEFESGMLLVRECLVLATCSTANSSAHTGMPAVRFATTPTRVASSKGTKTRMMLRAP